jgi:ATP-dependent RNA helicase RhlE
MNSIVTAATSNSFSSLQLLSPLLKALETEGYLTPTPIQTLAIPQVLSGRDILGWAQTGTGKTAAFALPVLQLLSQEKEKVDPKLKRSLKCLVLAPTRELAQQIGESFVAYGRNLPLRSTTVFGGVGLQPQIETLRRGVDILVATPGRLLDLMNQGALSLSEIQILVLDEADRMLDMGFINDIRKVISKIPAKRQTLLFSATMASEIQKLAETLLKNPARVEVAPISSTAETILQSLYYVDRKDKPALLKHLLETQSISRALIFTRTKHLANRVSEFLTKSGISSEPFHSNKSQNARIRALANFKKGNTRVLVATDIAARGIDIDEITHVFNFDLPNDSETYVHRIGRTGRAGASGIAISFCGSDERAFLAGIERTIRRKVPVIADHPFKMPESRTISYSENPNRPSYPQGQEPRRLRPNPVVVRAPDAEPRVVISKDRGFRSNSGS